MRIFLSYGHDEHASLATRIQRDLESQGHKVWFDVDRLKDGRDWEPNIEDGLDWASAIPDEGRFLLLLTPHSVRRPDGYCLNELARAFARSLPIIPVMVSTVEPPLSICRLQWLDMRNCLPLGKREEQYKEKFIQLVTALTEKQVPFEGTQQRLLNYLEPISYGDDLTRHLARFIGREWVMTEVKQWLGSSRRVLWITGQAGVGKSALAAWLCNCRPEIAAYHFCRFGNSDRVNPRKALFSLAYQLSSQFSVYRDRLNASPLDKIVVETNVPAIFDQLFANILTDDVRLSGGPQVILIDALDEASHDGKNELASLIATQLSRLPPWLRVIATSRPHEQEINLALNALDPWRLDAGRGENLDDIRKFLRRELRPFTGGSTPREDVINTIVDKSEGLFLYVRQALQEMQDGRLSLGEVDRFPRGLGGVYADFFSRYFPDPRQYAATCRPALEAICAAREPMESRDLVALLNWSEYDMRSLAAHVGSLFPLVDGRVSPFHHSVRDWLTDPERSGPYWIDVSAQEERLAELAWREYKAGVSTMGSYCIKYAPSHLAASQRSQELEQLLLDPAWIEAKLRKAGIAALLTDYDSALAVPISLVGNADLRLVKDALVLSAHVLANDETQLNSQLLGRLLSAESSRVQEMLASFTRNRRIPWLRPLAPSLIPSGGPVLRILLGHTDFINSVAITPDGRLAVSSSDDRSIRVWDLQTGTEHCRFIDSSGVGTIAISLNGRILSASSDRSDRNLRVWDVHSKARIGTLPQQEIPRCVAITPDGRYGACGSEGNTVSLWDLDTGTRLHVLTGHTHYVYALAFRADGSQLISASHDCTLRQWDLQTGSLVRTFCGDTWPIGAVAITPDGEKIISGSADGTLRVWNSHSGVQLRVIAARGPIKALALLSMGRQVLAVDGNGRLKLWDLASGSEVNEPPDYSASALAASGANRVVASSHDALAVLNSENRARSIRRSSHSSGILTLVVTADGRQAVSLSRDGTFKTWEFYTGSELSVMSSPGERVTVGSIATDGRTALVVRSSGSSPKPPPIEIWDLEKQAKRQILAPRTVYSGESWRTTALYLIPGGKEAISVCEDFDRGLLKMWSLENGTEQRSFDVMDSSGGLDLYVPEGHEERINAVAMAPDGRRVVSGSDDKTMILWDLETGTELATLKGHNGPVTAIAAMADTQVIVSASDDTTLKVWDLETRDEVLTLAGHTNSVKAVSLARNGHWAASASSDHTVRVWDLRTGSVLASFVADAPMTACAFTPDARSLVAGDGMGCVHFLRLEIANTDSVALGAKRVDQ